MSAVHKAILLNGQPVATSIDLTPWTDFSWADELQYIIDVQTVTGTPTAGKLVAKLQHGTPHKTSAYQWSSQRLQDFDAAQITGHIPEGSDFGTLWDQAGGTPTPKVFRRTILRPGPRCNLRLNFDTAMVGGAVQLAVVMLAKKY